MKALIIITTLLLVGCVDKTDQQLITESNQAVNQRISAMNFKTCSDIVANKQLFTTQSINEMCGYVINKDKPVYFNSSSVITKDGDSYVCSTGNGVSYTGEVVTFRAAYKDGDKTPTVVVDMPDSMVPKSVMIVREVQTDIIKSHCN